jgi:hypothetical protein
MVIHRMAVHDVRNAIVVAVAQRMIRDAPHHAVMPAMAARRPATRGPNGGNRVANDRGFRGRNPEQTEGHQRPYSQNTSAQDAIT